MVNMPSLPALVFAFAILLIAVALIASPLLGRRKTAVEPPTPGQQLNIEHERVVRAIRELDDDHRTGKLNGDDYKTLRATQVMEGAQLLQKLDELNDDQPPAEPGAADELDVEIEQRILLARKLV